MNLVSPLQILEKLIANKKFPFSQSGESTCVTLDPAHRRNSR